MSHFVTFQGYGVGAREVTVAVARVTHFWPVSYNGNWGVEIELDTGKTLTVRGFEIEVRRALEAAAAELRGAA
ncbi:MULTISPECIES: hypothetical protein [unclassified Variovorax]|uniref:hypothetical protein n=1 Tax=unclassified Variovorax TaxID=663243 RepID=UPI003F4610CA